MEVWEVIVMGELCMCVDVIVKVIGWVWYIDDYVMVGMCYVKYVCSFIVYGYVVSINDE